MRGLGLKRVGCKTGQADFFVKKYDEKTRFFCSRKWFLGVVLQFVLAVGWQPSFFKQVVQADQSWKSKGSICGDQEFLVLRAAVFFSWY